MSDLDKLMSKLKKDKVDDTPKDDDLNTNDDNSPDTDEEEDYEDDQEDLDEDEVEEMKPLPKKIEKVADAPKPKETPQETEGLDQQTVEQEVAILQNTGIYRREMLAIQRERNLLLNAIAHMLSDALGGNNANKKK